MTFEEYKSTVKSIRVHERELTDIECPKCGKKIFKRIDIILTSDPPQYIFECDCGWSGFAP